ncbi:oxidoreductase [Micromonospora fluostatini]|uniref:Oxidoreductase n=1 Tax=Micromonospora fluostatini TaxID=1629071 RepID=A0ABY2DH90_9ACTN|nr:oxidoreductase [Micromonospora fluostatini]
MSEGGPAGGSWYDVVVAGGGPAGAAATAALVRAGRSVLLADAGHRTPRAGQALPGAARRMLNELGLPTPDAAGGHQRCLANLSAWNSDTLACVDTILDPYGHGWHLDRPLYDRQLRAATVAAGARTLDDTRVTEALREPGDAWTLRLRSAMGARWVRCAWLVEATGRAGAIARRHGGHYRTTDRLIGVEVRVPAADSALAASLVEAAPDGWWYAAPAANGHGVLTYFTDADLAPADLHRPLRYRALLARHHHVTAAVQEVAEWAPPRRVAAHSIHLTSPYGDGWIAAGDAAIAFDPLSSQGILTALYTGLAAGRAVDRHIRGERDALPGYAANLARIRAAYRRHHRDAYRREQRWISRPFWHRRR